MSAAADLAAQLNREEMFAVKFGHNDKEITLSVVQAAALLTYIREAREGQRAEALRSIGIIIND